MTDRRVEGIAAMFSSLCEGTGVVGFSEEGAHALASAAIGWVDADLADPDTAHRMNVAAVVASTGPLHVPLNPQIEEAWDHVRRAALAEWRGER